MFRAGTLEVLSPSCQAFLRGTPHGLIRGWDFYAGLVADGELLETMRQESLLARTRELCTIVPRSRGDFCNSLVEPGQLPEYPATQLFTNEVARHIGGRILSAQFNFYGRDGELLPHSDGPNCNPETAVILSIVGEGAFDVMPDLYAGYGDGERVKVNPGDGVVLHPIQARDARQYNSRRHAATNTSDSQRISLATVYSVDGLPVTPL